MKAPMDVPPTTCPHGMPHSVRAGWRPPARPATPTGSRKSAPTLPARQDPGRPSVLPHPQRPRPAHIVGSGATANSDRSSGAPEQQLSAQPPRGGVGAGSGSGEGSCLHVCGVPTQPETAPGRSRGPRTAGVGTGGRSGQSDTERQEAGRPEPTTDAELTQVPEAL